MAAPIRTCVGCRRRGPAADMLRLTIESGTVHVGTHRKGSGRGASVHRDAACIEAARRPGVLARAFKRPVDQAAFGSDAVVASTISHSSSVSRK